MTEIIYQSPAVVVGNHLWTTVVLDLGTARFQEWRWRHAFDRQPGWRSHKLWPRYDFNNGQTLGLPVTALEKLARFQPRVRAALEGRRDATTELTPEGEQYVIPGTERPACLDPKVPRQGSLW